MRAAFPSSVDLWDELEEEDTQTSIESLPARLERLKRESDKP